MNKYYNGKLITGPNDINDALKDLLSDACPNGFTVCGIDNNGAPYAMSTDRRINDARKCRLLNTIKNAYTTLVNEQLDEDDVDPVCCVEVPYMPANAD